MEHYNEEIDYTKLSLPGSMFYMSVLNSQGVGRSILSINGQKTIATKYEEEFAVEVGIVPDALETDDELDYIVALYIDGKPVMSGYKILSRTIPKVKFTGFEQPDGKLKAFKFLPTTKGESKSNKDPVFGTIRANIYDYTLLEEKPSGEYLQQSKDVAVKLEDKKKADLAVGQGSDVGSVKYTASMKLGFLQMSLELWYNLLTPQTEEKDEN